MMAVSIKQSNYFLAGILALAADPGLLGHLFDLHGAIPPFQASDQSPGNPGPLPLRVEC